MFLPIICVADTLLAEHINALIVKVLLKRSFYESSLSNMQVFTLKYVIQCARSMCLLGVSSVSVEYNWLTMNYKMYLDRYE